MVPRPEVSKKRRRKRSAQSLHRTSSLVADDAIHHVLIRRLLEFIYDPFEVMFWRKRMPDFAKVKPNENWTEKHRMTRIQDAGRIVYFRNRFERREVVDPIILAADPERFVAGSHSKKSLHLPVVEDGAHRLCGALLANRRRIRAIFAVDLSGEVAPAVVRYLVGGPRDF